MLAGNNWKINVNIKMISMILLNMPERAKVDEEADKNKLINHLNNYKFRMICYMFNPPQTLITCPVT